MSAAAQAGISQGIWLVSFPMIFFMSNWKKNFLEKIFLFVSFSGNRKHCDSFLTVEFWSSDIGGLLVTKHYFLGGRGAGCQQV